MTNSGKKVVSRDQVLEEDEKVRRSFLNLLQTRLTLTSLRGEGSRSKWLYRLALAYPMIYLAGRQVARLLRGVRLQLSLGGVGVEYDRNLKRAFSKPFAGGNLEGLKRLLCKCKLQCN